MSARGVVVVGGGVGGLAASVRLAVAGHRVTLLERNGVVGGKLAARERDGFVFDLGPSLLTMPGVFDELFRRGGTRLADEVELVRLDPQLRYHWPDGSSLTVHDDPETTAAAFEAFHPGSGDGYRRFLDRGRRIWEVSERTFFAGPMSGPTQLARRLRSPFDLTAIDPFRSLARAGAACFDDPRLVQWAGRYATYSGSSPYRAPATLACIAHLEADQGVWYPMGGMGSLCDALQRLAERVGVEVRTGAEVIRILDDGGAVRGVELADGTTVPAHVVVANVDADHLYAELLPDPEALRRVRRARRSTSGFVVLAAVTGLTPGLVHHNVWFSRDYAGEFAALDAGRLAEDPTIYACVSVVTDPTQAPGGDENWFLLVNTPAGIDIDAPAYETLVLERLVAAGIDLRSRLRFTETVTPTDLAARYRSPGGAIYGTSSNGRRAAFLRPGNRGACTGLYLVGGSSHPGGGLPLVTMSARIVADMVRDDGW